MPIQKKWSVYLKANVMQEPNEYAVYELGNTNSGEVLYIGEGQLRAR